MRKILLICTGGTIASKKTDNGLAPELTAKDLLEYIPEIISEGRISVEAVQLFNIDSTNMTPSHWCHIAEAIEKNYDRYDGFVICHGTDTMAYTSAALSYMVQGSSKPIVVTGSQKPIDLSNTDGRQNLTDSIIYAADEASAGVCIVFDGNVIAGTRAKKMRSKSYNAFFSVNFPELAVIRDGKIIRYITPEKSESAPVFYRELSESIVILKLIPGLAPGILEYLFENYDCILIESFGVGGIPDGLLNEFSNQMKSRAAEGKLVVMATQVVNEGSNMEVYEVGRRVKEAFDLMETYDMTQEAAVTKLMLLMKLYGRDREKIRKEFYKTVNYDILYSGN